jgi:hypothetical protein
MLLLTSCVLHVLLCCSYVFNLTQEEFELGSFNVTVDATAPGLTLPVQPLTFVTSLLHHPLLSVSVYKASCKISYGGCSSVCVNLHCQHACPNESPL